MGFFFSDLSIRYPNLYFLPVHPTQKKVENFMFLITFVIYKKNIFLLSFFFKNLIMKILQFKQKKNDQFFCKKIFFPIYFTIFQIQLQPFFTLKFFILRKSWREYFLPIHGSLERKKKIFLSLPCPSIPNVRSSFAKIFF